MESARSKGPTTAARLERLVEGSSRLIGEYSLVGVLQGVADLAAELIGARFAAVGILGSDGRTLESFTTAGITHPERERIGRPPTGSGVLGLVIREARPIRLADIWAHPASQGFPPNHPEMRSFLGVPILGRRATLGNLYLAEKIGAAEFTEEDEHLDTAVEARTIPQTLQAIDIVINENDLLELFCTCIEKNKSIGIYDGAYKCVELATGKKFNRVDGKAIY